MLTRRARMLIIGGVITLLLAATLFIEAPEATRTVDEVLDDLDGLEGRQIAIRGEVLNGSIDNSTSTFVIHGESSELLIDFTKAVVSNGLENDRTIYAEGVLVNSEGTWVFEAEVIKTSCPSKYEEQGD